MRPPSRAPPSGAWATSDLPRQPESGSAHCFVTVRPLFAWPYHQRINERCRTLHRKSLCPAPSPRRARRQRATIAILVEENAYWLDANRRSFGFIPEDSKGGWLRCKDRLRSRRLAANVKCSAQPARRGGRMESQGCERDRWVKPRGRKKRERVSQNFRSLDATPLSAHSKL